MSKLAKSIEAQELVLKELQKDFEDFSNDIAARKSKGYINAWLIDIEEVFKRAKKEHTSIVNSSADPLKDKYNSDETYSKIKRIYFNFVGQLHDAIDQFAEVHTGNLEISRLNASKSSVSDIRLPRIQIKPFSGNFEEWSEFYNLFLNMIDQNIDLSDVQKLQYLKTSVCGEAARLIQHLPIDAKNYNSAFEILKERYQNKRKLVNTQLRILMEQERISHESASKLKSLHDTSTECIHALANLGISVETWDCILVYIIFHKLPPQTQRDWEDKLGTTKALPDWKTFSSFIEGRFNSLESIQELNSSPKHQIQSTPYRRANAFHIKSQQANRQFLCRLCKSAHGIRHCKKFVSMDAKTRADVTRKNAICSNCLGYDHQASNCSSSNRCYKCGQKHHTMLHIEPQATSSNHQGSQMNFQRSSNPQYNTINHFTQSAIHPNLPNKLESEHENQFTSDNTFNSHLNQLHSKALLATALVNVIAANGTQHTLRALIDPGSEATFITENATQLLNLKKQRVSANVTGLGQTSTGTTKHQVDFTISSLTNPTFRIDVRAFVFSQLTAKLPTHVLQVDKWYHLSDLPLADPSYYIPGKIDILIGADIYSSIILEGLVKGQRGSPIAQLTELGWILTGSTNDKVHSKSFTVHNHFNSLDVQLRQFWEIEEDLDVRKLTPEEMKCQQHFIRTFQRRTDGKYEVQLPFKNNKRPHLGNSKRAAMARFFQIEKKFASNKTFYETYSACINEYITLGHMKEVTPPTDDEHYYLPHHAVFKESSTTTKLRVVFDASCKTSNGSSLNDFLMIGPRLQPDIIDLIAKWRKFKVGFSADISMMYRQIWVAQRDTPYQLILWRNHKTDPVKTYALNTVTFGTASAPYLAVRTLHQLAADTNLSHPHVAKVITEGFYVDDLIYGADSEENAILLQRDIVAIMRTAGFPLRKWASNSSKVLEQISEGEREINLPLNFDKPDAIKTLGVQWHPANDVFKFKIDLPEVDQYTKRSVLADIARLFDPLGWISPCILRAKLILQQLWRTESSWDAPISKGLERTWVDLRNGITKLQSIEIPRWIGFEGSSRVQLHGFSDASERAYAAVVYARTFQTGQEQIHIIASKTRVAPIKPISLPRLELCASLLLAKLLHRIARCMQFNNVEIFAWSDSMISLAWIKGDPSIRTIFVANRVTEIQTLTSPNSWRHVGTKENPADIGSRGLAPEELVCNSMWWHGPSFLKNFSLADHPIIAPSETTLETRKQTKEGITQASFYNKNLKTVLTNFASIASYCTSVSNKFFETCSTLRRLIRLVAIWRRFINNLRPEKRISISEQPISADELEGAHNQLIKIVQSALYPDEIKALKENKPLSKGSSILNLNPFLDRDELLRVGGRLANSSLPLQQRHPIILKEDHHLARLIVREVHQSTLHGGQQMVMAEVRRTYWITNLKRMVKATIHRCVRCHRHNAKMQSQLMGNLPAERVTISRPFTNTGVDYAGPVEIKMWKGRCNKISKGYIAVFICLSTKAIHIELVSDLSAASFIAAFRRFVARRGSCTNLFSDCGSNFKGANNELQRDSKFISLEWSREVAATLASQRTTWHFNPPSSPHFGGLWEAGVKSMKHHLKRTIGTSKLTFEEYATLLAQIEACLNSRPLCPMTTDPEDLTVLTPGHFLIGEPLRTHPERNLEDKAISNLDRWKYIQRLTQEFWKQWSAAYLHHLQYRPKWLQKRPNLNVGDIVLLKDDNLPPSLWSLELRSYSPRTTPRFGRTYACSNNQNRNFYLQTSDCKTIPPAGFKSHNPS